MTKLPTNERNVCYKGIWIKIEDKETAYRISLSVLSTAKYCYGSYTDALRKALRWIDTFRV